MKQLIVILALIVSLTTVSAQTNTNAFYAAKDVTIELAPTITSKNFSGKPGTYTLGYSYATGYWQTENTATIVEVGSYDLASFGTIGPIDHIAAIQEVRLIPWEFSNSWLNRISFNMQLGAETYLLDGTKDLEIGPGIDFALSKKTRLSINYMQHWRTDPELDNGTITVGFQFRF